MPPGAPVESHDSLLLARTLTTANRQLDGLLPDDRACHWTANDRRPTGQLLDELGLAARSAAKATPPRSSLAPAGSSGCTQPFRCSSRTGGELQPLDGQVRHDTHAAPLRSSPAQGWGSA